MEKKLIINADDFGWDSETVEGILNLSSTNNISSTTILATHAMESDLKELKRIRSVSKGIHINLIDGTPVSKYSEVKSLTDENGFFYSSSQLFKRFVLKKIKRSELETEIRNQISKLKKMGIEISHADSHRHIHQFPILGNAVQDILYRAGIKKIRNSKVNSISDKRRMIVKLFTLYPNRSFNKFNHPDLLLCDFSVKKDASDGIFKNSLEKAFKNNHTVELMTHPATLNRSGCYLKRKSEYEYLMNGNWKELIKEQDIKLISYDQL